MIIIKILRIYKSMDKKLINDLKNSIFTITYIFYTNAKHRTSQHKS